MAPPHKFALEERELLLAYLPDFIKRQAEGKLSLFWPIFLKAFFAKFSEYARLGLPVPGSKDARRLTDDEIQLAGKAITDKKAQIMNWFRNNRAKLVSANNSGADSAIASMLARILKLGPAKRGRAHQAVEVFQKRNPELIKAALIAAGYDLLNKKNEADEEDDWADESEETPAAQLKRNKSQRMRLRTKVVHGLWKEASPEEREAVMEDLEAEKAKAREEALAGGSEEELPRTPAQRQEGIDALETLFAAVHKVIFQAMGWVGFTVCGGPNPRMNGELTLKVICFGETAEGNDFEACYLDFNKYIIQAFQDFLRICFSPDDCSAWAMPTSVPSVADGRPVQRVAPDESTEERPTPVTATKKSKSKSKSKTKSKTKSKKTASSTNDNANTAPMPSADTLDPVSPLENGASEPPSSPSRGFEDRVSDEEEDWMVQRDESFDDDNMRDDGPEPMAHAWPAGMTAPLSPEAANAIGIIERGGTLNLATMAIDPQLLDLDLQVPAAPSHSPPPTTTPSCPRPKPAFRQPEAAPAPAAVESLVVGPTVNVEGYNFPVTVAHTPTATSAVVATTPTVSTAISMPATPATDASSLFPRSALFSAFTPRPPALSSKPWFPTTSMFSPGPTAVTPAPSQPHQTWAARHMLSIIADSDNDKRTAPSSSPPLPPHNTTPSSPSITPVSHASAAALATVPAVPAESPSTPAPVPVIPRSRPAVQTPTASKKTSAALAPEKEVAAAQAAKVASVKEGVKKARGRPRKSPLTDITNQFIDNAEPTPSSPPSSSTTPAAATTSTEPPPTSSPSPSFPSTSTTNPLSPAIQPPIENLTIDKGTINICVDPGRFGNRHHAKLAAEKAKKEEAAAAAKKNKGWVERVVQGASVVTFNGPASVSTTAAPARTSARGRPLKTAKRPDGTDVQAVTKGTRKAVAAEPSVAAAGKKRKAASAPTTTKPSGKRRKA
ncbi:hypothetical protein R3P38DRAFT_3190020 [Favolaschia claudopus]|uniref:Proteophosphoglycan ppg4 n=1 Tax=Favolaschia claudopus TaxID=2862362 RepID=A0AAW0BNY4_9AGAR